jgi:AcrR family transcriptional regulator
MPAEFATRQRILETASALFYQEGIRAISIDTIVERSGSGKATLYRHFPTKDDLIAAYLEEEDRRHWLWFDEAIAPHEGSPRDQLLAWFEACSKRLTSLGFRGCPFLNALAEFTDVNHPARLYSIRHEVKLRGRLARLARLAGAREPKQLTDQLILIINGALSSTPLSGTTSHAAQLNIIATHMIDLQLNPLPTPH